MVARHTSDFIYQIIGAAYEVQHEIGYGLLEAVYNEAMCMELQKRNVDVQSEVEVPIYYKGEKMKKRYRVDLLCENIIIELKVADGLTSEHRFQLFNYMRHQYAIWTFDQLWSKNGSVRTVSVGYGDTKSNLLLTIQTQI